MLLQEQILSKDKQMPQSLVSEADIEAFQKDGVVLVKGLFRNYIEDLKQGVAKNMQNTRI